jgi:hypothetical protein
LVTSQDTGDPLPYAVCSSLGFQIQIWPCRPERALQGAYRFTKTPRVLCLLALACAPLLLPAQTFMSEILTLSPAQCIWHRGDDPAWASVALDESGWRPLATSKLDPSEPRIWKRCHADSAAFSQTDEPAL